ncbi:MAG: ribosome biogenesis GTPase YlqF [Spirochaetales bacterium]|nr:ribosome biogenesis GTPase YlqF [Spirochaetales bacterium]
MNKTRRLISENVNKVDVVIEIVEARAPLSSRNPMIGEIVKEKPLVILLNKADLADPSILNLWISWFGEKGIPAIPITATLKADVKKIIAGCKKAVADTGKVIQDRPLKGMIIGIPNVGKSTLFNTLAGKTKAKVGNTPGVTREFQLIRIGDGLQLFDTPGVLWHKFEDPLVGVHLAVIGSIKDSILPLEEVAVEACKLWKELYPEQLKARYNLEELNEVPELLLEDIGRRRGCIRKGGVIDYEKAAKILLADIRSGRIGVFCLEKPPLEAEPVLVQGSGDRNA